MSTFYLDLENGNDANDGTTFANRWKTYTSGATAARLTAGDTVRVMASPDETLVGNATWTTGSKTLTLAAAVTKNIADGSASWTPSTNVTSATNSNRKEGASSVNVAVGSAFTTGVAAVLPIYMAGSSPSLSNRSANVLGPASLTQLKSGSFDDELCEIDLPFSVFYNGVYYNHVRVCSNSWFGFGSSFTPAEYHNFTGANPPVPNFQIGAADNSYQRVYAGSENSGNTFRIRYEGTNATGGTAGSPTIVWEVTFDKTNPGTIKIDIGTNTYVASPASGFADGVNTAYFASFSSGISNTGYTLTQTSSNVDFSAYKQVSFWVLNDAAIADGATLSLRLCSDAAGTTTVNTIPIPAIPSTGQWVPVTVDLGTALSSSVGSICLYCDKDPGTITVTLDNIIACKDSTSADALTLTSLIGKVWNRCWTASTTYAANDIRKPSQPNRNGYRYKVTAGGGGSSGSSEPTWPPEIGATVTDGALTWTCEGMEDTWYGVQSINGTTVVLDREVNSVASDTLGYYRGATETVATYRRETIKVGTMTATAGNGYFSSANYVQKSGVTFSGGWDRTAMSSQSGETWVSGRNGCGQGLHTNGLNVTLRNLNHVRFFKGIIYNPATTSDSEIDFANCHNNNNTYDGLGETGGAYPPRSYKMVGMVGNNNGSNGHVIALATYGVVQMRAIVNNANNIGVYAANDGAVLRAKDIDAKGNFYYGVSLSASSMVDVEISGLTTNNNGTYSINGGVYGGLRLTNFVSADSTLFAAMNANRNNSIYSHRHGGVAGSHLITTDGGSIISATDQRHTASGISWKFRPTSTNRTSKYPLTMSVAKIACTSGVSRTVSIWTRRDNTNVNGTLKVRGGQLAGVPVDVTTACAPTINTWTQYSATFTPSETGVIEVVFEVYDGVGTTNNFWIDDLAVS